MINTEGLKWEKVPHAEIYYANGSVAIYSITQRSSGEFAHLVIQIGEKKERRRFESIQNAMIFAGIHNKQR